MRDSFVRFGNINASCAFDDSFLCNGHIPLCDACTVVVSGNTAMGPFCILCTLYNNLLCCVLK